VLNAADYFRAAALHDGIAPDPRVADAIDVIRAARQPDGTWLQERRHPGRVWFEVDVPPGEPSKWLTFYGTRILGWVGRDGSPRSRLGHRRHERLTLLRRKPTHDRSGVVGPVQATRASRTGFCPLRC